MLRPKTVLYVRLPLSIHTHMVMLRCVHCTKSRFYPNPNPANASEFSRTRTLKVHA